MPHQDLAGRSLELILNGGSWKPYIKFLYYAVCILFFSYMPIGFMVGLHVALHDMGNQR